MDNVARIEIVRGPASSLYGSDAMGGVINIITKNPQKQEWNLDVETKWFSGGSNEGQNWMLRYDSGKHGKFGWSVSGGEKNDEPYLKANGETANYYGERRPFNFKGVWEPSTNEKVILDVDYLNEDISKKTLASGQIRPTRNRNERTDYSLAYETKKANSDYQFRIYQSAYDKDYEYRTATGALSSFDVARRETTVGEFKATQEWRQNHLITYGGEYREEWIRATRINTGDGSFLETREGRTSTGSIGSVAYSALYLQDEWKMSDKFLIIPALRYDGSDKFNAAWSPKLGVTYHMAANSRLKAAYGHGFKTPTPTELYHSFLMTPTWLWQGNPDLQPEESRSAEIAWEWEQGPRSGRIGFFHSSLTDYIDYYNTGQTSGAATIYSYRNIASATMSGIEAEVRQKLSDTWSTGLTYAYTDAVDDGSGERLKRRATHKIGADLAYTAEAGDFTGSLSGSWLSGYLDDSASPVQERTYAIWNLMLNKRLDANTTVYAGVDNIGNTKIESMWINGAVYRAGVRYKF
jgi:outer membrane receptor for ferrienterochelin and colicins